MNLYQQALALEKQAYTYDLYDAEPTFDYDRRNTFNPKTLLKDISTGSLTGAGTLGLYTLAMLASKGKLGKRIDKLIHGPKGGLLNLVAHTPRETSRAIREGFDVWSPIKAPHLATTVLAGGGILGGAAGAADNALENAWYKFTHQN